MLTGTNEQIRKLPNRIVYSVSVQTKSNSFPTISVLVSSFCTAFEVIIDGWENIVGVEPAALGGVHQSLLQADLPPPPNTRKG